MAGPAAALLTGGVMYHGPAVMVGMVLVMMGCVGWGCTGGGGVLGVGPHHGGGVVLVGRGVSRRRGRRSAVLGVRRRGWSSVVMVRRGGRIRSITARTSVLLVVR